jgi:hypothetical protein
MKLDMRMRIDAPCEDAYDLIADVGNEAQWNPDVKVLRRVDTGDLGVGAEWDGDYRGMGTMRVRLTEYDRPRSVAFTTTGSRMNMHFRFDFEPTSDGLSSNVRARADIVPRGITKLVGPLLSPMMRRTMAKRPAQIAEGIHNARVRRGEAAS